ncbi:MAG: hypothetical protein V4812_15015 [Pseudomonadota bacterium]
MKEHLAIRDIEQILDLCMPSFYSTCKHCMDGTLTFQFHSRTNPDALSIVGIPATGCRKCSTDPNSWEALLGGFCLGTAASVPGQA